MARTMLGGILSIVSMHTIAIYTIVRLRFPVAVVGGWFTLAIFLGFLVSIGTPGPALLRIGDLLAVANVAGMFACYQMDLYVRREYVAMLLREHAELEARRARASAVAATQAENEVLAQHIHEPRT